MSNYFLRVEIPSHYSLKVVHKCLYWYTGEFDVEIRESRDGFEVKLTPLGRSLSEADENLIRQKINRDLIDYYLREEINNETKNVRELIIAKAFSQFDDFTVDLGDVSDPVGFNPNC
jgi:His-Xaa-Ser system protein HxsD